MTRRKPRNRRAHRQLLTVGGISFKPASLKADGTRKGRATSTIAVETLDVDDPSILLELVGSVQDATVELKIDPFGDAELELVESLWKGSATIKGSTLTPPKEAAPGLHSRAKVVLEVVSDDPQHHLDLFSTRLQMDGRDTWEAWVSLTLVQSDFTLPGGSADRDPAHEEDPLDLVE